MKLTGKCKDDFEKYLNKLRKHDTERKFADVEMILESQGYYFEDIPQSMQYGVYVDFFDSLGIDIDVFKSKFILKFYNTVNGLESYPFKTRQEARTKAIEKANELYNKQ